MVQLRKIFFLFIALCLVQTAIGQAPDWTVNASDYQYTMTVTAFLNVNGRTLVSAEDRVGAFVNNEVRGVTNLIFVESADRYLAYLTIYGNAQGEEIAFKIYDSGNDAVVSVDSTLAFRIDQQVGSVFQAFSIANPTLSNEAEIKSFYFANVDTISTSIADDKVNIVLERDQGVMNLTPEFIINDGAKMYINRVLQESGSKAMDFSFPITYSVLSEDESVLNTYEVSVGTKEGGAETGFRSTNVVTANNDGSNDFWIVQDASSYKKYQFKIFDVNGRVLFKSMGYGNNWDGYYKGRRLDRGKYYFKVVNEEKGSVITGDILVLY